MNNNRTANQRKGEYRIDEMIRNIYDSETANQENGSELMEDELTSAEKDRILQIAMSRIENERTTPPVRSMKKRGILVAVLVAVFAFATTAFAAELFQWDNRISSYLGIGEHNRDTLSGGGMDIGVSDTANGVKIEAVQSIGDANNMYILLDITAPEGETIYPNTRFDMIYLSVEGASSLGYSCDMLPDANENDNKATMLLAMDANKKINQKQIKLSFKDMGHYIAGSGEVISDYEGEWSLEWKLDYRDISTEYQTDQKLMIDKELLNVDSISVSPIALNVRLSGSFIEKYDSQPPEPGAGSLVDITAITLKDGTVLTQDDASSWGTSTHGKEYVINIQMKSLLDVKQVKSITLNDTEFVLDESH